MHRFLSLIVVLLAAASLRADPPTVAELVKQLGDPRFAVRETAQKELLKRGEGIVPELDRLVKGVDAETADRIGRVRYRLIGYKDDIRRLLADVHEGKDSAPVPIADQLRGLIADHQPGSGDLLLDILSGPQNQRYRQALRTFVATWNVATPDQIDAYVRRIVTLATRHRPRFPAKVGAMISFEAQLQEGWTGWPQPEPTGFTFKTRTTCYLDGKPYDKPYEYRYPFATAGWYRVGELAEGTHTIHAVMDYEFTQRGQTRRGAIRSKGSTFEVLSADTPDELVAPKSDVLTKVVREKFTIRESEHDPKAFTGVQVGTLPSQGVDHHWYPQVTWEPKKGITAGIHCPVRLLREPLDVDLCFDAEIHDVKTGTVYPCDPVVVRAKNVGRDWIVPKDVRAFANDRDGFVTVKVVLRPSRALALSDPRVRSYYPEPITSDEMRMKVYQKVEIQP